MRFRSAYVAAITVIAIAGAVSVADARVRSHHHVVQHFVFASPQQAADASSAGAFGGHFETGIPGASTADPYTRPAYGYDGHGYDGPGFAYPGY